MEQSRRETFCSSELEPTELLYVVLVRPRLFRVVLGLFLSLSSLAQSSQPRRAARGALTLYLAYA